MYPFDSVYEQEWKMYSYQQNNFTNNKWYEKFNTRPDANRTIRVIRQHKVLLEHMYELKNSDSFEKITGEEQKINSGCRGMITCLRLITIECESACNTEE